MNQTSEISFVVAVVALLIAAAGAVMGARSPETMDNADPFLRSQWRIHRAAMFLFIAVAGGASLSGVLSLLTLAELA